MKNFLDIDLNQLEKEWVQQASLYAEHAENLADARRDLDIAKNTLEVVDAEIDRDIRLNPGDFGLTKITEDVVKRVIVLQKPHQNAVIAVIEARHKVGILEATVTGLDHKKKALENAVSLWIGSYFSTPRAKENSREKIGEVERDDAFRQNKRRAK